MIKAMVVIIMMLLIVCLDLNRKLKIATVQRDRAVLVVKEYTKEQSHQPWLLSSINGPVNQEFVFKLCKWGMVK